MDDFIKQFSSLWNNAEFVGYAKAVVIAVSGLVTARLISRRLKFKSFGDQQTMVLRNFLSATILGFAAIWTLKLLGIDLGILLGAAGILTVALGFASQTSASNMISGLFLMWEKSFSVGELIRVGSTEGYVNSIDFLSVKIRTFDNLLVRIPNETMLKSEVANMSRFPIRRMDYRLGVAYKEDIRRVRNVLFSLAENNPLALDEPGPRFFVKAFGDSAVEFQFSVWTCQEPFYKTRSEFFIEIKEAFDREGIEIPFPHLSLYTGSTTSPMPLSVTDTRSSQ